MKKPKDLGLWTDRLKPERENPREVAFAAQWQDEQRRTSRGRQLLDYLLLDTTTDRDRIVAATIIQWLGSGVGFGFLEQALRRCGYKIVDGGADGN